MSTKRKHPKRQINQPLNSYNRKVGWFKFDPNYLYTLPAFKVLGTSAQLILIDMIREYYKSTTNDTCSNTFMYSYPRCMIAVSNRTFYAARKEILASGWFKRAPSTRSTRFAEDLFQRSDAYITFHPARIDSKNPLSEQFKTAWKEVCAREVKKKETLNKDRDRRLHKLQSQMPSDEMSRNTVGKNVTEQSAEIGPTVGKNVTEQSTLGARYRRKKRHGDLDISSQSGNIIHPDWPIRLQRQGRDRDLIETVDSICV